MASTNAFRKFSYKNLLTVNVFQKYGCGNGAFRKYNFENRFVVFIVTNFCVSKLFTDLCSYKTNCGIMLCLLDIYSLGKESFCLRQFQSSFAGRFKKLFWQKKQGNFTAR